MLRKARISALEAKAGRTLVPVEPLISRQDWERWLDWVRRDWGAATAWGCRQPWYGDARELMIFGAIPAVVEELEERALRLVREGFAAADLLQAVFNVGEPHSWKPLRRRTCLPIAPEPEWSFAAMVAFMHWQDLSPHLIPVLVALGRRRDAEASERRGEVARESAGITEPPPAWHHRLAFRSVVELEAVVDAWLVGQGVEAIGDWEGFGRSCEPATPEAARGGPSAAPTVGARDPLHVGV